MLPLIFFLSFEPNSFAVSLPPHLCSEYASFKRPSGRTEDSLRLGSSPVPVVSSSAPLCFPTVPQNSWPRTFPIFSFSTWRDAIWFISWVQWTNCCCMWTYLYVNCWCTEEPAACTAFPPLDSSRGCWFSLWRTRPLSPSARTAPWYSIQNEMPYVNKRTLLTVTSCVGFLWAWESSLNWSQRALQPSVFWLTSAASLCCLLMRVTDLQASNFRLLSLLCQWTCCSIP